MRAWRYLILLLVLAASGCMLVGAATMPDPKPDPIARIKAGPTRCAGTEYEYRVHLTGKSYVPTVHSDPLGFLLYGHWTEQSMDADICLHSIVGEVQPRDTVMDGYVGKYWVGEFRFSTNRLYINLKSPKTKDSDSEPYRFNGEYSLVRE